MKWYNYIGITSEEWGAISISRTYNKVVLINTERYADTQDRNNVRIFCLAYAYTQAYLRSMFYTKLWYDNDMDDIKTHIFDVASTSQFSMLGSALLCEWNPVTPRARNVMTPTANPTMPS